MKSKIIILLFFIAACQHDDRGDLLLIPKLELTCTAAGAGNSIYNGYYTDNYYLHNGKRMYVMIEINDAPTILFNPTYGWSIAHRFAINDILYYSNSFGDTPPDLGATQWQVLNGTPPGPTVSVGTRTTFIFFGGGT